MPGQDIARQWFVPAEGIDRHVITADIQRYLGNDATVRPGKGSGPHEGVEGYWIRAYRNLTSAMIQDLKADSARWRHEQRQAGGRGSSSPSVHSMSGITGPDYLPVDGYTNSRTYESGNASRSQRSNADSPALDPPYGVPPARGGRGQVDAMQIDPPMQADRRYGQPAQPNRGYPPENGAYPPQGGRERYPDAGRPQYQQDQPMMDAYGRIPVSQPYPPQDPRYGSSYPLSPNDVPSGYVRQGDHYVTMTSGYTQAPVMAPSRPEPMNYPPGPFGQPPEPPRDVRGGRGDPRDGRDARYPSQDYNDPSRYYPSPATTAATVNGRDTIASPVAPRFAQPTGNSSSAIANADSGYPGAPQQYDQYGRRKYPGDSPYGAGTDWSAPAVQQPSTPYGAPESGYPPRQAGRQQPPAQNGDRDRDARRRRLH